MRSRQFGVEIELGYPGGVYAANKMLTSNGFEPWTYDIHEDGSGVEICSPILKGAEGFNALKSVMKLLVDNGGYVTTADGMHVHHDAPEFIDDEVAVARLVETWVNNQALVDSFVHTSRHNSWAARKDWNDPGAVEHLKANGRRRTGKVRGALNIAALDEHGTVEFRQHEGCLDFRVASAWIEFGQAMMDAALRRKEPVLTCRTPKELLYRIRTSEYASSVLLTKDNTVLLNEGEGDEDDYEGCGGCDCSSCCGSCGCCCSCGDEDDEGEW